MAKKPKGDGEDDGKVKSSEVKQAISKNKLKSLMSSARSTRKDVAELTGGLGSEIKTAVENNHLHKKAFSVICTLDRMEPEKLADFLDHFYLYLDISGLEERAKTAQRLEFGPGKENEESEEDPKPPRGKNVTAFPAQTAVAAE